MAAPPKVFYGTEAEYRTHFARVYCRGPIVTFDRIPVWFRPADFDHCMFESTRRDGAKDTLSRDRVERIDWISATLRNPRAELFCGWSRRHRCVDRDRRVAVVYEEYVVVIDVHLKGDGNRSARFVTAFLADSSIAKIRSMPKWGE
jgi:hypothetical protein